jgi:hypothetical protein
MALSNPAAFSVVAHLASLTITAFSVCPTLACDVCWYLTSFLPFLGTPSILTLFEKICASDPKDRAVHEWLVEYGLAGDIARVLNEADYSRNVDPIGGYMDDIVERIAGCYSVIVIAAQNPVLALSFQSPDIVAALAKRYNTPPDFLCGARWRAIRRVCTPMNIDQMSEIVDSAIRIQFQPHSMPTQELVEALAFVTHAIGISEVVARRVGNTQIFQILLGMLVQFDTASILHAAIREFALEALQHKELCSRALSVMLPFLMTEAVLHDYGFVGVTCWMLIDAMHRKMLDGSLATDTFVCRAEFDAFASDELCRQRERLTKNYGGRGGGIPQCPQDVFTAGGACGT